MSTNNLRDMVMAALQEAGGQNYLLAQANGHPGVFMSLVGKCLPKEIKADVTSKSVVSNLTPDQQRGIAEAILSGIGGDHAAKH